MGALNAALLRRAAMIGNESKLAWRGQTPLSRAQSRVCGSASEPSRSRVSIRRGQTPLEIDYSRLTKEGAKRLIARHGRSQPHTPIRMGDTALGA